jgi:8-oxo-dGTP diphosphatase
MPTLGVFAAIFDDNGRILCVRMNYATRAWTYSKPLKDDLVIFFRARVLGRNQWQPNDEISEMGYFGRDELPESMGLGARTRILDALDGVAGIVRVIPET